MTRLMSSFFILLLPLLFAFTAQAQYAYEILDKQHEPGRLKKDIDFVKNRLEKHHPDLYRFIDKARLNKKFDSLKAAIKEPMNSIAFNMKLSSLLSDIGDGHLVIAPDGSKFSRKDIDSLKQYDHPAIAAFEYIAIDQQLYITKNRSQDKSLLPGTEILSIDQKPASEIIETLLRPISSDGYNRTYKYYVLNAGNLPNIYKAIFGAKDTLRFEVKDSPAAAGTRAVLIWSNPDAGKRDSADRKAAVAALMPDKHIRYLRVRSFFDETEKNVSYPAIFKDIREQQVSTLILDLRGNPGGSNLRAGQLLTYLIDTPGYFVKRPDQLIKGKILPSFDKLRNQQIKYYKESGLFYKPAPDTNGFKGKIYVLINGGSFSAATLVAANLQGMKRVTFVGEETGGGRNGWTAGYFDTQELPESKLVLRFGIIPFEFVHQSETKGRGVMPGISIRYSLEDRLLKKDAELEWVLKDIKKAPFGGFNSSGE